MPLSTAVRKTVVKRPRLLKKLLRSRTLYGVFASLLYAYSRMVFKSMTIEKKGAEYPDGAKIIVFWHSDMFMMPFFKPLGEETYALASRHSDGRIVSKVMERFGLQVIEGSRRKGGLRATVTAVKAIRDGHNVAITPDGPKGPARKAAAGVVYLASRTGASIIPVSFFSTNSVRLNSWDRFVIPFPFGKGVFTCGQAIHVPPGAEGAELERYRFMVEGALDAISEGA